MAFPDRLDLYKQIEAHRKRPLIAYVTSKRPGVGRDASMASDALPYLIEQLDALPSGTKRLDFLIASNGGDPMVAWRIMCLMRQRVSHVSVLIPQSAYSAATLVALGANEIIMHPNGNLGPVDFQITAFGEQGAKSFSTEDISAFLDFVRDTLHITDQEQIRSLFEVTCREVSTVGLGFTARSSKLAIELGEKLLRMHFGDGKEKGKASKEKVAVKTMIDNLSRKFHSHGHAIGRIEATDIGLPVNAKRDKVLEPLMWKLWLNLEDELQERTAFSIIGELLKSPEAGKLLTPVPQLELPPNAAGPSQFQAGMDDVKNAAVTKIDPVNFKLTVAAMESQRIAHSQVTEGIILSCRRPDLNIQYSVFVKNKGWVKTSGTTSA